MSSTASRGRRSTSPPTVGTWPRVTSSLPRESRCGVCGSPCGPGSASIRRALGESPLAPGREDAGRPAAGALRRGYAFLRDSQLTVELHGYREEHRDPVLGGWCFSDGAHRWPVSDCTAEAVSALLAAHDT